jgi:hypothetical protein
MIRIFLSILAFVLLTLLQGCVSVEVPQEAKRTAWQLSKQSPTRWIVIALQIPHHRLSGLVDKWDDAGLFFPNATTGMVHVRPSDLPAAWASDLTKWHVLSPLEIPTAKEIEKVIQDSPRNKNLLMTIDTGQFQELKWEESFWESLSRANANEAFGTIITTHAPSTVSDIRTWPKPRAKWESHLFEAFTLENATAAQRARLSSALKQKQGYSLILTKQMIASGVHYVATVSKGVPHSFVSFFNGFIEQNFTANGPDVIAVRETTLLAQALVAPLWFFSPQLRQPSTTNNLVVSWQDVRHFLRAHVGQEKGVQDAFSPFLVF